MKEIKQAIVIAAKAIGLIIALYAFWQIVVLLMWAAAEAGIMM